MIFSHTCSAISDSELSALLDLADTTSVGWDTTDTARACDWSGVTCKDNTVVELLLQDRGLTGHLPESLGNLIHLKKCIASDNALSGQIPGSIGNLTHLKDFDVYGNALSGQLPVSMGNLQSITFLDLGINQFTGPVFMLSGLKSLEVLRLTANQFTDSLDFLSGLSSLTTLYLGRNDFYGLIPPAVAELCERETTRCLFGDNNRLCGNGERVLGPTCSPCPSKANCAAFGECHNGFDPSDYYCSTCPSNHFDAGGSCVKCTRGAFGVVAPVLLFGTAILIIATMVWFLKRLNILKEHHLNKVFNLNMDTQTKAKQATTVVQVLSEVSKFNNLPYPQWFLSFSLFASLLTMPFQPQPACVPDFNLASYQNGVLVFFGVELFIQFLMRLHSTPILHNHISAKAKERCQMMASILATIAVVPILRVALDAPTLVSRIFKITSDEQNAEGIVAASINIIINIATAIFIVAYMYFRVETMAWKYSAERLKYMENPEQYASDEDSQLKKGLPFLASFCANYTPFSLFHESKATRRKIFCYLISALTTLIEFGANAIQLMIDDQRIMRSVKSSLPIITSLLPKRVNAATIPLTISCLQTVLYLATHFLYLRHVAKRPYLSFRASTVYGDALNDTEVLITRVLCATPTLFTILQALSTKPSDNKALNVVGHVFAILVLLGIFWSMKRLVFGLTDPFKSFRASINQDRDSNRTRAHSAASEEGVSDKIEAMMNTKNVIERWELERTLNWKLMSENEKARWKVETKHNHPSILKRFGLVIVCICGVVFLFFTFFLLVLHSTSTSWAQWLWFTAAMLGGISVDAYAVQCLSDEDGDILHSYIRGFSRSTSRQASKVNEDENEIENGDEENGDQENPVVEEEVVASPVHSNENENNTTTTTTAPADQIIELTEVKTPSRPQHHTRKRPSMIRNPSSKPSVPVSTLTKKFEAPKSAAL
ncbi:hypothetical protein TL16_g05497 [Triparma laevis f. inornata]|uniref:Leucine-rich repeat-containing N-terminal plant-type domain-containing protein n=1 Tax=Triparma laevis f. inornata TaxID=1714386 RepID=A0A9W7AF72_9STRA|nr:hypothetical protein TL16_g05497 [Triparma laevis f. inornata]